MSEYSDEFVELEEQVPYSQNLLFDREMEEALIGAVLINPEILVEVVSFLNPEDFYLKRHQWIWEAFISLDQEKHYLDLLTVKEVLESRGQLEDVGGLDYLIKLSNRVPSSLHALSYARTISELKTRRRLTDSAQTIAKLAYHKEKSLDSVIDEAERAIFNVSENRYKRDLVPIGDVASDYLARVTEASSSDEEIGGMKTGLKSVDNILDGLHKSDFIIVAGRPGMGKTGFLIGIAKHVGMVLRRNVAMFSIEMAAEQLLQRMLAQETEIDSQKLRSGRFTDQEAEVLTRAITKFEHTNIYIDDTPGITPLQMSAKCRRLKDEHSLDLVIVDYLQLMSGDRRSENRVQEVSYISRQLKILARDLDVPVMAAAQLSRAVEQRQDKQPILSDLRESGSLEQDADIVMFINRPFMDDETSPYHNIAKLAIAKHRNGPTHSGIELVFLDRLAQFKDKAYIDKK
ncbi:MAG: replicative DNA helicase [Chloroflexi bacterium]|jgi:replicative DNA helicase|nr:replicative DNA helicase [Chloroflexota bacterium]